MDKELNDIQIKMKALGFSQQQIESIIKECLCDSNWEEMSSKEKKQVLQSLDNRIAFIRKFLKFLNCKTCWK